MYRCFWFWWLYCAFCAPCCAITYAQVDIGTAHGAAFAFKNLRAQIDLTQHAAELHAASIDLPKPIGHLEDVRLRCAKFTLNADKIGCQNTQIRLPIVGLQRATWRLDWEIARKTGQLSAKFSDLRLANGQITLHFTGTVESWRGKFESQNLEIQKVLPILAHYGVPIEQITPFAPTGTVQAMFAEFSGARYHVQSVQLKTRVTDFSAQNPTVKLALLERPKIQADILFKAHLNAQKKWQFDADMTGSSVLAGGKTQFSLAGNLAGWRGTVDAQQLDIPQILPMLAQYGVKIDQITPFAPTGIVQTLHATFSGAQTQVQTVQLTTQLTEFSAKNPAVQTSTAQNPKIQAQIALNARVDSEQKWQFDAEMTGSAPVANGQTQFSVAGNLAGWRGKFDAQRLEIAKLLPILANYGVPIAPVLPFSPTGSIQTTHAEFSGTQTTLNNIVLRAALEKINLQNEESTKQTENIALQFNVNAEQFAEKAWQGALNVEIKDGQAYFEPIFVDFKANIAALKTRFIWQNQALSFSALDVLQEKIGKISGNLAIQTDKFGIISGDLQSSEMDLAVLYEKYLKDFFIGTAASDLAMSGLAQAKLSWQSQALAQVDVRLDQVFVRDKTQHYGLEKLDGHVYWGKNNVFPSSLHWEKGYFYKIPFGASEIAFTAQANNFTLDAPFRLPVLDGQVSIAQFALTQRTKKDFDLQIQADLEKISLEKLTESLGWTKMAGTLSGHLPSATLQNGVLRLPADVVAKVFDGEITISDLTLRDVFGKYPQLQTSIRINRLDLQQLTQTFAFGSIQGRLDGYMRDIYLFNWRLVSFDGAFYTPKKDRSKHRISQKAVRTLSDAGGGGAGALLSKSFLRFFENFPYDKLGIYCTMRDDVCEMNGIKPHENNGYYLVKGKWLPRLNIIGHTKRVQWSVLLNQVQQAIESSKNKE